MASKAKVCDFREKLQCNVVTVASLPGFLFSCVITLQQMSYTVGYNVRLETLAYST